MKFKINYNEQTRELKVEGNRKKDKFYFSKTLKENDAIKFEDAKTNVLNFSEYLITSYNWDWEFLLEMMELKLKAMRDYFAKAEIVLESKDMAKEIDHCLSLIESFRNHDDGYDLDKANGKDSDKQREYILSHYAEEERKFKDIFNYLGERMRYWWD